MTAADSSIGEIARTYLRRGWAAIPVPYRTKNPDRPGWQHLRLTEADLATAFPDRPLNVGVLLGTPSAGLADVDLDAPVAVLLADGLLPATRAVFGRAAAPRSHRLYQVRGMLATKRWRDPTVPHGDTRAVVLEVRVDGAQTLFPGSTHPAGEAIAWDEEGDPGEVEADNLMRSVGRLAAIVLLARHWPGAGSRHDAALALAGGLLRAGWAVEEVTAFITAVATGAGDEEPEDRARAAVSSAQAHQAGRATTGWPTLSRLIDARAVTAVIDWLGIRQANTNPSSEAFAAEKPEPEAVARAIAVPAFPLEVFPPRVHAYLERGAAAVGCPPDLVAVPFLGYAAAAIGRTRVLRVKSRWAQKATLWLGVVAASGEGKSPADAYARAALDELQAEADERYQAQMAAYTADLARWKATDPKTRGEEPRAPVYEHWYSTDATVEALAPMLQHNPGVALSCDELVAWARGCNAYKKHGNDRQKYLEIWNGRPLKVDRKTQGVVFVREPVLGIVGGIQPHRLPEMTREASAHDGLLPRFLWTYPDVPAAAWSWEETEIDDLAGMVELCRALRQAPVAVPPLVLHPDPEARTLWKGWYDDTMAGRKVLPPLAREVASKFPAQLARLWLVLTALWDPRGTADMASAARLVDAITLIEYFRAHARRVLAHFGTAAPHVDAGLAGRVRAILEQARVECAATGGWLAKTAIWNALHRNPTSAALEDALAALVAEGIIERREEATATNKRTLFRICQPNVSYEADEEFNAWDDEEANASFDSYEVFDTQARAEPRRCFACGGNRFSPDGVCLTCHPRRGAEAGSQP